MDEADVIELRRERDELRRCEMAYEEKNAILHDEVVAWIKASIAAARLINEQRSRLATICRIANDRLAATENMASIQEAETLWAIISVVEGDSEH